MGNGTKTLTARSNSGKVISLVKDAAVNGVSRVSATDGEGRKVVYTIKTGGWKRLLIP